MPAAKHAACSVASITVSGEPPNISVVIASPAAWNFSTTTSVVVPIYGMFILGGAALGIAFLDEALTMQKVVGLLLAIVGVVLVAA